MKTKDYKSRDYSDVVREALYLEAQDTHLFTWIHTPTAQVWRNEVVIICSPMGYEYTHSHRTLKHLADTLAQQGFIALRFDFHGMGDSPGSELDPNRVDTWLANINSVVEYGRHCYPKSRIALAGLRFGATLACLYAKQHSVDHLILWEPVVKGKAFVRELTALSRFAAAQTTETDFIESAGFLMSEATAASIKNINVLNEIPTLSGACLIAWRDDRDVSDELANAFEAAQQRHGQMTLAGYDEMMAEPQNTEVPQLALDKIVQWLIIETNGLLTAACVANPKLTGSIEFNVGSKHIALREQAHWCDSAQQLFGITSEPAVARPDLPAIILSNSGSVHHVGPNRVYTLLARTLAALGYCVLRLDHSGLGDSCHAPVERENHPYQPQAIDNIFEAMSYLQQNYGKQKFIVAGICSGAHTAFHAALTAIDSGRAALISDVLLINPLTFYWQEGMSLAIPSETQNLHDAAYYRQSMRNMDKWKKLFTGKADTRYIFSYALKRIKNLVKGKLKDTRELLFKQLGQLSTDLKRLMDNGIRVRFFLSSSDPGFDIIKSQSRHIMRRGLAKKTMLITMIDGADHTFSKKAKRDLLLALIEQQFSKTAEHQEKPYLSTQEAQI